jgi:predicted transcriptional regulator
MTGQAKVLRIGIASRDVMRDRTLAIARGAFKPRAEEPKVWFTSIESLAQVLSSKNQILLELIRSARPASVKELASISGRAVSNLSRTLHTLERYGLVRLNKAGHGRIAPEVPYDRLAFEFTIAAQVAKVEQVRAHVH